MELQYRRKHILASMVCGGTLPFRMLAAEYGADITYGEEIVDHRLLRCTRKINKMLGTVDLVEKSKDTFVVQTCDEEKSCGVFQFGTSDVVRALQAANLVF
jgi:tRNA-dihydrouridine synthase 2